MRGFRGHYLALALLAIGAPIASQALAKDTAQDYPNRPIRIVVGFTPGGAPDVTARFIGQKLSEKWKQPVVVENRAGAGGALAAAHVANSPPDGYTMFSVTSSHAVAPAINSKLPYDTLKDFSSVTMTSIAPTWVLVSPSLGVKTLGEFVAMAKAKPGHLNFSTAGVGSFMHFAAELFNDAAGIKAQHIPLKGPPEALTEVMAGRVQYTVSPIGVAAPLVKDGKLIALGITGKKRLKDFPNVPTVAESGYPGLNIQTWTGLIVPAKTPPAIVAKLNKEVGEILRMPDVVKRWEAFGVDTVPTTPAEFDKIIADDVAAFTKAAKAANIASK
jgi:tripartite-type tricarboxylate transporter receptor subunit TctC